MRSLRGRNCPVFLVPLFVLSMARGGSDAGNCTFQTDPGAFLKAELRARQDVFHRAASYRPEKGAPGRPAAVAASQIPRRNFIDVEIFDRLQKSGIASAPVSSDEEFFRRIHLDLTGRIPAGDDVRGFLADADPDKRNALIDRLLYSPEYTEKWTQWLGDLLQNNATATNFSRQNGGRNAYHNWIRGAVADGKPLKDIAYEAVTGRGNNYSDANNAGAANFLAGGRSNGPIQDTYDLIAYKTAAAFLGMGHFDCLVCHDGRRHLDSLSLWGKSATRLDAYRMSAFFSRVRFTVDGNRESPLFNSLTVTDAAAGTYDLNTNFGNRPTRSPIGALRNLTPEYWITGGKPTDNDWRSAFAESMIRDPMFARNFANRLWKQMFGLALVEPEDALDPARLDPARPPESPWTLQATHPQLLERLAAELVNQNFDLRSFLRLLAESSAYQLSSRYDGEWKVESVALFARHFPRRLEGEEVHDAIARATGILGRYTVQGWPDPVLWAMQLPEPVEPRSNGAVASFMNSFYRGNRDTQVRRQSGSILQQLNLMNDAFVLSRNKVAASPVLQRVVRMTDNTAAVDELYLQFLSRLPSAYERERAAAHFGRAPSRNAAVEDLAWALMNKVEFILSY